jgi:hypothetical protein
MSFRNLAFEKFPNAVSITGTGRFALKDSENGVHLFESREAASKWTAYYDSVIFDLKPVDFDAIPGRYERQRS